MEKRVYPFKNESYCISFNLVFAELMRKVAATEDLHYPLFIPVPIHKNPRHYRRIQ